MDQDKLQTVFHAVIRAHVNSTALKNFNPTDLSGLATVNKVSRTELSGDHHWRSSSGKWTPEYCGPVKTFGNKPFKTLARRWWGGDPGVAAILGQAHGAQGAEEGDRGVLAVQISPDDPLTAWSIGDDGFLVRTDLENNEIRARVDAYPGPYDDNANGNGNVVCLSVLGCHSGLVCTSGDEFRVKIWDINQLGNAANQQPAFNINLGQPGAHNDQCAASSILSAGQTAGHGFTLLLTGGWDGKVCLWDLRKPTGPPVRSYQDPGNDDYITSLAIDLPRRNLYAGCYTHGVVCWNWDSGTVKARMPCPKRCVRTLVVGTDCVAALAYDDEENWDHDEDDVWDPEQGIGSAYEWGHPGPQPVQGDVLHRATLALKHDNDEAWPTCVLGLGEGPDMLLAGTSDGRIRLMEREIVPMPENWDLGGQPYPDVPVTAMAATDNILVAGYGNGALHIYPMNTAY